MRIIYCTSDYSRTGGTDRTLSIQANYFAEHGHEVHIVTTELPQKDKPAFYFSDKIKFHNLKINYQEVDNSMSLTKIVRRIQKGITHKRKMIKLLYTLHPDFTISLFEHEISFLFKIKDGSLKILQYHFSRYSRSIELQGNKVRFPQKPFALFKEWRKRSLIKYYDAFIVLTKEDAHAWGNLPNLHVITNSISFIPDKFSNCLNKQIISVGRLTTQKGYDLLLAAWQKICYKYPDWQLSIYGQGKDHEYLQQIIQEHALGNSVHIFPPTKDIINQYINASIYVMSSRYEGFPMVLPEAMVCGLPCVSFAAPCGPSEIITQGEDGFIVPPEDIQGLAEKLELLMENENLRCEMGKKARSNIMRYSVDNIMQQWEKLFNNLLKSKSSLKVTSTL